MAYGLGRLENMYSCEVSLPVDSHTGNHTAFLRRYQQEAADAVKEGFNGIVRLGPKLSKWIADTRNQRTAWDYLRRYGGTAPGPNRLKYDGLTNSEAWELCRALRKAIVKETYTPGPDREVRIPKTSGKGYRTLRLQNIQDRVVARAVVQIVQPLLDPQFDENSLGYRPGRDRRHALAAVKRLTEAEDRWIWVPEDVKDAFDQVPQQRLLDVVHKSLPAAEDLWGLIERTLGNGTKRGLRQGSPLSPLLLNLYLDHFLDRVWRKQLPDTPLLRSADDLLVLCRTQQEALEARDFLRRILSPAGMPLKEPLQSKAIRNLDNVDKADWLGFEASRGKDGLEVHISAATWSVLEERLRLAHQKSAAPLRAIQTVKGWIEQIGPCFPHEDKDLIVSRIADMARQMAFDELPDVLDLQELWREGHSRWQRLLQDSMSANSSMSLSGHIDSDDDGSADRHVFCAAKCRSDGAPHGAPSLSFSPSEKVTLYTDGACDRFSRQGGWAAIFMAPSLPEGMRGSGRLLHTTNNRAELIAVIKGLERLSEPTQLQIVSDSEYVVRGITENLPRWKSQGWRAGSGRHRRDLQNTNLWQALDALLEPHAVACRWVRGHSGNRWNEECDRLAHAASLLPLRVV